MSLAKCIKWDASGGKSGSAFVKTKGKIRHRRMKIAVILNALY
jgi:hypothetical protein